MMYLHSCGEILEVLHSTGDWIVVVVGHAYSPWTAVGSRWCWLHDDGLMLTNTTETRADPSLRRSYARPGLKCCCDYIL